MVHFANGRTNESNGSCPITFGKVNGMSRSLPQRLQRMIEMSGTRRVTFGPFM